MPLAPQARLLGTQGLELGFIGFVPGTLAFPAFALVFGVVCQLLQSHAL
jgi:hypothetical protein